MINKEIIGLHVLTDRQLLEPRSVIEVIAMVIEGGASAIQLRDKNTSDEEMIDLGKKILKLTIGRVPFIVNDRVRVALAIGADGIHVGQKDMPADQVRKLIGPDMILGVSASTIAQAIKAQEDGADYLGVGPIFSTRTKTDADPPIGLDGLSDIRNAVSLPIIAIGGIKKRNAPQVMQFADGIAVISAVLRAGDPLQATRELAIIINKYKI